MDWPIVASLAAAFGAGTVITKVIDVMVKWRTGKYEKAHSNWRTIDRVHRDKQAVTEVLYETRHGWNRDTGKPYDEMPQLPAHLRPGEGGPGS